MAAVRVSRGVRIVLEQIDVPSNPLFGETLLSINHKAFENSLPRLVVGHRGNYVVAFRRRVLGMTSHVEIKPGSIPQKNIRRAPP